MTLNIYTTQHQKSVKQNIKYDNNIIYISLLQYIFWPTKGWGMSPYKFFYLISNIADCMAICLSIFNAVDGFIGLKTCMTLLVLEHEGFSAFKNDFAVNLQIRRIK